MECFIIGFVAGMAGAACILPLNYLLDTHNTG